MRDELVEADSLAPHEVDRSRRDAAGRLGDDRTEVGAHERIEVDA
jgi:hypothetical protein